VLTEDAARRRAAEVFWLRVHRFQVILFHRHLFVVWASLPVLLVSRPVVLKEMERVALTPQALASALVDSPQADLERSRSARP
jgi:hypothetical protein